MTGLSTATALAAKGFSVFPIAAGAKAPPLWADWPNRATTEPDRANWPDGVNTGIHCAGLIVIDVDPKNGGDQSYAELDMFEGFLPTLTARTPSGGRHLFYALPAGHPGVPNSAGALGHGIDVKSTRGYVVGAGSQTANGEYAWIGPDAPIAPAPEWLLLELGHSVPKLGAIAPEMGMLGRPIPDAGPSTLERATAWLAGRAGAVEGQGGDAHTFATAAFLRDYGVSEGQAVELMLGWNATCSPPWAPNELGVKVRNAYNYGQSEPGNRAVTPDDFPVVQESPLSTQSGQNVGTSPQVPTKRSTLRLSDFATSRTDGPGYLVKGLLTQRSYGELYGPPGAGKTFVALDIAYHVAAGSDWMGNRVHQGLVLYLAYEGTGGLVKRAQALRQHYGSKDVPFYVTSADFNLREPAGRQALGCVIAELPAKPSLVVIDTFARALMGGDENSAQDVGAFNQAVAALIESTGACVLILHHTGKDKNRGPRGSSALQGAIDTEIEIDGRTLVPTKQRDMECGVPIGYKLTPIIVGMDEDNDTVTSCIVEAHAVTGPADVNLKGNMRLGWDALCMLRPTNVPATVDEWKGACAEFLGGKDLNRRFYDIKSRLHSARLIETNEEGLIVRRMTE
jgi:hypothetical protein